MPGRHEFETEYDNDAEQYVKDMVFDENDSEEDVCKIWRGGGGDPAFFYI